MCRDCKEGALENTSDVDVAISELLYGKVDKRLISVVRQHCSIINKSLTQSTVTLNTWIRISFSALA